MYFLHLRRHIISLLLIPLIAGVTFNAIKNGHFHKLWDGEVIYHSHPYKKDTSPPDSPFQKHHHSPSEYLLLHQITHEPFLPANELSFLDAPVIDKKVQQPVYIIHHFESLSYLYSSPRAPPFEAYR
mgnify:FL=1